MNHSPVVSLWSAFQTNRDHNKTLSTTTLALCSPILVNCQHSPVQFFSFLICVLLLPWKQWAALIKYFWFYFTSLPITYINYIPRQIPCNICFISSASAESNESGGKEPEKSLYSIWRQLLVFQFFWWVDVTCPSSECFVPGEKPSINAVVPGNLKRHFTTKHTSLVYKDITYFRCLVQQNKEHEKSRKLVLM
jgi:hypothetical protein